MFSSANPAIISRYYKFISVVYYCIAVMVIISGIPLLFVYGLGLVYFIIGAIYIYLGMTMKDAILKITVLNNETTATNAKQAINQSINQLHVDITNVIVLTILGIILIMFSGLSLLSILVSLPRFTG